MNKLYKVLPKYSLIVLYGDDPIPIKEIYKEIGSNVLVVEKGNKLYIIVNGIYYENT